MSRKVLIIDDEEDIRSYLDSLLSDNGYQTALAEDGEEGFQALTDFLPDIIILDIIMPNKSGVGFYRKLKKSETHKDIPVVVLTGFSGYKEFFSRDYHTLPKPELFMEKPIIPEDLLKKIAALLT
jgi:CheY-like chemotaxis protein